MPKKNESTRVKVLALVVAVAVVLSAFWYAGSFNGKPQQLYLLGTVTYSDGSTSTFDSRQAPTLTIQTPGGVTINGVNTNAYMTVQYTGSASSYVLTGTFGITIKDLTTGTYVYSTTMALTPTSTPTLVPGAALLICSSTITQAGLQGLYSGWVNGRSYQLTDSISNAGITVTFADGNQQSAYAGTAQISLTFMYRSGGPV